MGFNLWDALADAWDEIFVSAQMAVAKGEAKKKAAAYSLKGAGEEFDELWGLMVMAMVSGEINHDAAEKEVDRELALLRDLVDRAPAGSTAFGRPVTGLSDDGFRTLQVAPTAGRYAIFSDHHMLFAGCRQNFFTTGNFDKHTTARDGNRDLYLRVLAEYYGPEGYTLVENGDVEELLILEPELSEIRGIGKWPLRRIVDYRNGKKLPQLAAIARDNADYYRTIETQFIKPKRYFRLTGNHDRDMRDQAFADAVSKAVGIDMPLASDALLLRGAARVDFIICHGHQFDTSCTPKFAAELGESLTQAGAWAIQGPDRAWRTDFDPIDDWLSGSRSFNNTLVSDKAAGAHRPDLPFGIEVPSDVKKIALAVGKLLGELDKPWQWEALMGKNVAWEYFDHADPTQAIKQEVDTGDRWFKLRHLNEIRIVDGLRDAFAGAHLPTLVLGHSHEPRLRSTFPKRSGPTAVADCYLNSASAGRFQNMIWGLELIDGEPSVISWHQGDQTVGNQPVRTVWRDAQEGGKTVLRRTSSAPLDQLLTAVDDSRARMQLYIELEHVV